MYHSYRKHKTSKIAHPSSKRSIYLSAIAVIALLIAGLFSLVYIAHPIDFQFLYRYGMSHIHIPTDLFQRKPSDSHSLRRSDLKKLEEKKITTIDETMFQFPDILSKDSNDDDTLPQIKATHSQGQKEKTRKGTYTIQVMSFRLMRNAQLFVQALISRGYQAYVRRVDGNHGVFFRVKIGPFRHIAETRRYQKKLEQEGLYPFIIR